MSSAEQIDVLIIGGGPAGLTPPDALGRRMAGSVVVLEREREAGGIPRHSDHPGYGIRDLKRFLSGPAYARRLVASAADAGADLRTASMVTGWCGPTSVEVTSPGGRYRVDARAVVLATGARERPRSARLVPGDRPAGVLTTGQLQNVVHLHHGQVGSRAVVVGAELVSWSAVLTLRAAGVKTVLMTSVHPTAESYGLFTAVGKAALQVPVANRTRLTQIIGKPRVEAVEVVDLDTGARRRIACDTVVFTGDWIPDNELARAAAMRMDAGTLGPEVDSGLRTSAPGVFAVGNLLHPVDTADIAAFDGAHVVGSVLRHLAGGERLGSAVHLRADAPLRWISPSLIRAGDGPPARGRYLLWSDSLIRLPQVTIRQGGEMIEKRLLPWPASPGRVFRIPSSLFGGIDPAAGTVTVAVLEKWRPGR